MSPRVVNGVTVDDTFAEAFPMRGTAIVVTAGKVVALAASSDTPRVSTPGTSVQSVEPAGRYCSRQDSGAHTLSPVPGPGASAQNEMTERLRVTGSVQR